MGRKIKKSTSFRVAVDVLDALAQKADRISELTGRSYSVATIVDAALAIVAEQTDRDTIACIAKHQFGIDVAGERSGLFHDLADRMEKLTTGRGGDLPRLLSSEWIDLLSDMPIKGVKSNDLTWTIHLVIKKIRKNPDRIERVLDDHTAKVGSNELIQLFYRLIELVRGDKGQQELLHDMQVFYMTVSLLSDPESRPKINEVLKLKRASGNNEGMETIRMILELGESIASRASAIK